MNKHIITHFLITAEILLFLSLPVIAMQHIYAYTQKNEESIQLLAEESLSPVAKFKAYENTISFDVEISQSENKRNNTALTPYDTKPTKPVETVTPAVQSVSYAVEDVQPSAAAAPQPRPQSTPIEQPTVTATPQPVEITNSPQSLTPEQITYLGNCEAGMDPTKNTGNGYYGAFQFSYGTWKSMNTGYERADLAPLQVQIDAVQRLLQRSSIYTQFPACARKMQALKMI